MSTTVETDERIQQPLPLAGEALGSAVASKRFWRDWTPKAKDPTEVRQQWHKYVGKSSRPRPVDALLKATKGSLLWGLDPAWLEADTLDLWKISAPSKSNGASNPSKLNAAIAKWPSLGQMNHSSIDSALRHLLVAGVLSHSARTLSCDSWWRLLEVLAELLSEVDQWHIDADAPAAEVLAHQLVAGELRLTLAYLFPEIRSLYELRKPALETLAESMEELLDETGVPRASCLPVFRALVSCWTRCRAISDELNKTAWRKHCGEQFELAVSQSLLLSHADGSPVFGTAPAWVAEQLAAVIRAGGDRADRTAAIDYFPRKQTKLIGTKSGSSTREPSAESEWAELAILRTEFAGKAPLCAIDYSRSDLEIEVSLGRTLLFSGSWDFSTQIDGRTVGAGGNWEQVCWFSDEDVDFLELSLQLEDGVRLGRQILLARDDLFLLLTDNIASAGSKVKHEQRLPLAAGVDFRGEADTRDGELLSKKKSQAVLPLALPEWRTDPRVGELAADGERLVLTQERPGSRLSCPLFIDLDSKRRSKPRTWRQLTVAERLEIQPHDVAVGYRVQCSQEQWLIYRSLAPSANRTVLGQNTSQEYLVGRFLKPSGELEDLLEVEA